MIRMFFILCLVSEKMEENFNFKKIKIKSKIIIQHSRFHIVKASLSVLIIFGGKIGHVNHRSMSQVYFQIEVNLSI